MEKLLREAFRNLYSYLSLMDIMRLKTTYVLPIWCPRWEVELCQRTIFRTLCWALRRSARGPGEGPDHVTAFLSEFRDSDSCPLCRRPLEFQRSRCMAERRRAFKQSVLGSSFSSTLIYLFFLISLVRLPGRICNGSIMVVWAFLFCVTTDAY